MPGLGKSDKREYRCSCGKVFRHRMTLERHQHVNGCAPAVSEGAAEPTAPPVEAPPSESEAVAFAPEPLEETTQRICARPQVLAAPLSLPDTSRSAAREWWQEACREFLIWLVQLCQAAGDLMLQTCYVAREAVFRAAAMLFVLGIASLVVVSASPAENPHRPALDQAGSKPGGTVPDRESFSRAEAVPSQAFFPHRGAAPSPEAFPREAAAPSGGAEQAVQDFYSSVNQGSLGRAYSLLSVDWQREMSYLRFESGYQGTAQVQCEVTRSRSLGPGLTRVEFALDVLEDGRQVRYAGYHLVVESTQGWLLDDGHLLLVGG